MASETSELTFVRCPSCRSLVPATASRCRICNNPLEGSDGPGKAGESDAAKAASRVRQKTITATPEDVASALKQSTESRSNAAALQQPPQVAVAEQPQAVADDGDFDPLSAYLEELEEESAPLTAATSEVESPTAAEASAATPEPDDDFGFDIFDDLELETQSQQKPVQAQPAAAQSAHDDFDFLADLGDPFSAEAPKVEPVRAATPPPASPKPVAAVPESAPSTNAPVARGQEARRDEARREPPRPPAVQQPGKRDQNQRVQNNDRQPEKQQREAAQQSKRDGREQHQQQQQQSQQQSQRQQQQQPKPQQGQRGGERPHDERRGEERRSQESPRPPERKLDERRADDRRRDDRRNEDRRNDDRRQHSGAALPGDAVQVATAGPKTGKMRPGRLFGWFVSYENPDGRAIELREGKFFVTGSSIRATDLILEDPSISTPHALMAVSAEGGLVIQDLMSDRGVFVRSSGGGGYRREEGTVHVAHGDWIRFGDVEFLVIAVPQGSTR